MFNMLASKIEKMSNTDIKKIIHEEYKIDVDAIRNLSKLANDLTVNNKLIVPGGLEILGEVTMKKGLKITGTIAGQGSNCLELVGGLSVKNGTVIINRSDNYRALDVVGKGGVRVTGDIDASGNGYFGPAYIGKYGKTRSDYAQFSHKDSSSSKDYAVIHHSNGTTWLNSSKNKPINISYNDSTKTTFNSSGNLHVNGHIHSDKEISTKGGLYTNCSTHGTPSGGCGTAIRSSGHIVTKSLNASGSIVVGGAVGATGEIATKSGLYSKCKTIRSNGTGGSCGGHYTR